MLHARENESFKRQNENLRNNMNSILQQYIDTIFYCSVCRPSDNEFTLEAQWPLHGAGCLRTGPDLFRDIEIVTVEIACGAEGD